MTTKDAAVRLGCTQATIRNLIRRGIIKASKIDNEYDVDGRSLRAAKPDTGFRRGRRRARIFQGGESS
jgi:excisionase family DNA binding protein